MFRRTITVAIFCIITAAILATGSTFANSIGGCDAPVGTQEAIGCH